MLLIRPPPRIKFHVLLPLFISNLRVLRLLLLLFLGLAADRGFFVDCAHCARVIIRLIKIILRLALLRVDGVQLFVLDEDDLVVVADFAEVVAEHVHIIMRLLLILKSHLHRLMLLRTQLLILVIATLHITLVHYFLAPLELLMQLLFVFLWGFYY